MYVMNEKLRNEDRKQEIQEVKLFKERKDCIEQAVGKMMNRNNFQVVFTLLELTNALKTERSHAKGLKIHIRASSTVLMNNSNQYKILLITVQ